jgi:hypothetical protein
MEQSDLFCGTGSLGGTGIVVINRRCRFETRDGHCVVSVAGLPIAQYAAEDSMAEAYARVTLVNRGGQRRLRYRVPLAAAFVRYGATNGASNNSGSQDLGGRVGIRKANLVRPSGARSG